MSKTFRIKRHYEKLKTFSNLRFSSNMVLRTCPLFNKVRNEILSKNMGDIYHLEADYLGVVKKKSFQVGGQKQTFIPSFMEPLCI